MENFTKEEQASKCQFLVGNRVVFSALENIEATAATTREENKDGLNKLKGWVKKFMSASKVKGDVNEISKLRVLFPPCCEVVPSFRAFTASESGKEERVMEKKSSKTPIPLLLTHEYAADIHKYLFQLESKVTIREKHLPLCPVTRAELLNWLNSVHNELKLQMDTYFLSVAIFDRYLYLTEEITDRAELQLVGGAALFIAAKYEDTYIPSLSDFIYTINSSLLPQHMLQMEKKMLKKLSFDLSYPLPPQFLRRISVNAKIDSFRHTLAKYFLELSTLQYDLSLRKPSEVAAAALFLALQLTQRTKDSALGIDSSIWNSRLHHYSHYNATYLCPMAIRIAEAVKAAPISRLQAIYVKYKGPMLQAVADYPELYGQLIDSIIGCRI